MNAYSATYPSLFQATSGTAAALIVCWFVFGCAAAANAGKRGTPLQWLVAFAVLTALILAGGMVLYHSSWVDYGRQVTR